MSFLVAAVSGFAGGIFFRSIYEFGWPAVAFVLILAVIVLIVPRLRGTARCAYTICAVFFIFLALGMMRAAVAESPLPQSFAREVGKRVSYEGVVVADPDLRDKSQRVEIRVSRGGETATMLAVAPRTPTVAVGDRVFVSGTLKIPEPFATEDGRTFRYDKYLEREGVRFILNYAYVRVVESAPWHALPAILARIKHAFLDGLAAVLPEPHASLAGGIVIGGKSGLGNELRDVFITSGLVQIIVLSGYNVMIVAEWVMRFFAWLTGKTERWFGKRPPRYTSAAAGGIALVFFVGIAGFSATAVRAACMALIALFARATSRTYAAGRALLFVIFIMLLWNPLYLAFDPGFGLSIAATAGLIWLAPIIERMMDIVSPSSEDGLTMSKRRFWKNAVATTLAAQIAVLPLLLYETGNLSLVAIPANLLAMPIVPLAMGLSALAGFAGMLFDSTVLSASSIAPALGIAIALPAYLANAYIIWLARGAAALPFAAVTLPPFPFWLVLIAYAALICIAASKRFSTRPQLRFAKKAST